MNDGSPILFNCPRCQKRLRAKSPFAGKAIRCPNRSCGITIQVPHGEGPLEQQAARSPWLLLAGTAAVALVLCAAMACLWKSSTVRTQAAVDQARAEAAQAQAAAQTAGREAAQAQEQARVANADLTRARSDAQAALGEATRAQEQARVAATSLDQARAEANDARSELDQVKAARTSLNDSPPAIDQPNPTQDSWPTFLAALPFGNSEVRIINPRGWAVKVGLRCDGLGKDFTVPASGNRSVRVPSGNYEIYFQFADEPEAVYQGDNYNLADQHYAEITVKAVPGGNYRLHPVN